MRQKLLSAALAAAFALTAFATSSIADPSGSGDGGRTGGDWIINGTDLQGIKSPATSSLTVSKITLSEAK